MWAPDTYTGSASPVSALLAAGTKKMGFAAAFKVIIVGMVAARTEWSALFGVLAIFTMTIGNAAAVKQENLKRLLAYSSIAQAGYILAALAIVGAGGHPGVTAAAAAVFHSMTHMVMKAGAFIVVGALITLQIGDRMEDLKGLRHRSPLLCYIFTALMLSLVGMPFLPGFWSKYYIAFSLYYYTRVLRAMWFEEAPEGQPVVTPPWHITLVLIFVAAFLAFVGFYPEPFFQLSQAAAQALLGGLPGFP
jgi:NADH:ubiquinone oxidoreductase subunit 2 (subunit N)